VRNARIVATLGPSVAGVEKLSLLLEAGVDVARLNMSHGDHASHRAVLDDLRAASTATGRPVTTFIDLQGPKIRLGVFAAGPVSLVAGESFTITARAVPGDERECSTSYPDLARDVVAGDPVLVDDGRIQLRVTGTTDTDVQCLVVTGGMVSDHKGINLPGAALSVAALTAKDENDLLWGLANGVDMVALSFVRSARDIDPVHAVMDGAGRRVPVIAKIEKPQALDQLDAIVDAFDAIMVARGDLGVELPFEDVPLAQKRVIHAARTAAKPVIVATQMLESMVSAPRPTRAEASDVANAVMDGADAVMLSEETAAGEYPVEAVAAMARIIEAVEAHGGGEIDRILFDPRTVPGVVTWAAEAMARQMEAPYIVAFSLHGDTARRLARLRSSVPVLCFTPSEQTQRELGLVWGLRTRVSQAREPDGMIAEMDAVLTGEGLVARGETVVVVYGTPVGRPGMTNTVYVHKVGGTDADRAAG